ncbi:MAG: hypothetical protein GY711_16640 [bacterium]|nr:hypothetical protein [bacterium]
MQRRSFLMGGLAGTAWPLWNQQSGGSAELAKRLQHLILPTPGALGRRAAQCQASLTMTDRMTLALTPGRRPRLPDIDRAAAEVLQSTSKHAVENLADAALMRLWQNAPAGSSWNYASDDCPPCGMGFTPEVSRHFLEFFVK